jgi:hypothetical protein
MEQLGSADSQQSSGAVESKQDKVAYETYQKVLAEAKAAKERAKAAESQLQQYSESKLKEQNDWKALAEQKEKSLAETTQRLSELESTIVESVKLSAFQRHLGGKIKDEAYYSFVPVESIVYNPETKKVDEDSVKAAVSDFVKRHSSLVEFKQGKMPNVAPQDARFAPKDPSKMEKDEIIAELRKFGKI